jgi:hypothetical protein
MRYIRYLSRGNTQGLDQGIESYWELDDEGYIVRSVDLLKNGDLLKYSEKHLADSFGQLPEGRTTQDNLDDKSFGSCIRLTKNEFEKVWERKAANLSTQT